MLFKLFTRQTPVYLCNTKLFLPRYPTRVVLFLLVHSSSVAAMASCDSTNVEYTVRYHEQTKHHLNRYARSAGHLDWENQPNPFRRLAEYTHKYTFIFTHFLSFQIRDFIIISIFYICRSSSLYFSSSSASSSSLSSSPLIPYDT